VTPRRIHRIVLIALVALIALPASYLVRLQLQVGRTLNQYEAEIKAVLEDVPVRSWSVQPVFGSPEPGNGWELLAPALKEIHDCYPFVGSGTLRQKDPNLDSDVVQGDFPRLIPVLDSALQHCRQALRRSTWEWSGPPDPDLAEKVNRASRAFWAKAYFSRKTGRDAEALEWLIAACSVAQMAAWTGQEGTWGSMQSVERWLYGDAQLTLSGHDLTAAALLDIEHRVDLLRANRPPFRLRLRLCAAQTANRLLGNQIYELSDDPAVPPVPLLATAGWRDLYSRNVFAARILNDLDARVRQLEAMSWSPSGTSSQRAEDIRSQCRLDTVRSLLPSWQEFTHEQETLLRLDLLRLALAFARAQAQSGLFPKSASDAGLPLELGLPLRVGEDRLSPEVSEPMVELEWVIRRRTKD
jgi:hypothetical protein